MIYKAENEQGFFINCNCGCGHGLKFKIDSIEGEVCIELIAQKWYTDQDSFFSRWKKKCKNVWFVLRGKEYYYSDLILNNDEWESFRECINSAELIPKII